jgi:hypothetical protein
VAHSRLAKANPFRSFGDVPFKQKRIEGDE